MSSGNIQWFPGHMTRAFRQIEEQLKLISCIIEVCDARVPISSQNPMIKELAANKPRLLIFTKADLASPCKHDDALYVNCKSFNRANFLKSIDGCLADVIAKDKRRGLVGKVYRLAIVGVPNVGKSTLANALCGQKRAKIGDKPGVTKGLQWLSVGNKYELLDTPGVLWGRFDEPRHGENLALVGSISSNVVDFFHLASVLVQRLTECGEIECLHDKYGIESFVDYLDILKQIASNRRMLGKNGELEVERAAKVLIEEFRAGLLGRFTFE